jgi:hypothetical protein
MNFIPLDYVVAELLNNSDSNEQIKLKKFTGKNFRKDEAADLWKRIVDHKWLISEKLNRNVGFRVASVDYLDNFYTARTFDLTVRG